MTNINPASKVYLPFALPKYGNAQQQNQYFVQSAGQYLAPMRSFALSTVENFGGVPVHTETRPHNIEFKIVNGSHLMQIAKAMGFVITHMQEVSGGYKCFTRLNGPSVCFIQKRTVRGTSHVEYTAVLAMRHVARELFVGCFPPAPAQEQAPSFIEEAFGGAGEPIPAGHIDYLESLEAAPVPNEVSSSQLPFPEVQISLADLPAGL